MSVITLNISLQDFQGVTRQVAAFLGVTVDDAEVESLAHHCSFDQMKANPAVNKEHLVDAPGTTYKNTKFMRKGKVWKRVHE